MRRFSEVFKDHKVFEAFIQFLLEDMYKTRSYKTYQCLRKILDICDIHEHWFNLLKQYNLFEDCLLKTCSE